MPGESISSSTDQLREIAGLLWRNKWIVLTIFAVVVAAAFIYSQRLRDQYQASTLLLVEPQRGPTQQFDLRIGMSGRGQDELANEILVIHQSLALARRVARRLQEIDNESSVQLPLLRGASGDPLTTGQVAGRLFGSVSARRTGRGEDAIRISAVSYNPREAALIASTYAEEYIARTEEKSQEDVRGSREFLQGQSEKLRGRLDSLETRVSDYMSQQGAAALDQEASRTVTQIAELESQRDQVQLDLEMRRASLQATETDLDQIEPQLAERAASSVGSELSQMQEMLAQRRIELDQIYRENPSLRQSPNDAIRERQAEIDRLQSETQRLSSQYVEEGLAAGGINPAPSDGASGGGGGLSYVAEQRREAAQARIEINGLEAQLRAINQRLSEYRRKLETIPEQSMELAQMQRARQSTEQLYTFVEERLQETRIAEESKIAYAEVLNPAGVPGRPFRPDRQRILFLAALFGLFLGGGLVVLRERLDTRLRRPGDLEAREHGLLGVVPDMQSLIDDDFDGAETVTVDGRAFDTKLQMLLSPMSAPAEAYRRLRTNLQFSRPDASLQTLLVTSPSPGEGKSTTGLNTAIAVAQAGRRTLVVDADLRRPRVHEMVDGSAEPGLSDILFEHTELGDALFEPGIDDLFILPAGSEVPKPAELLGSDKMRAFIQRLREEFDVVFFDTPPVGTFSDAMLLAAQCDGAFLVGSAGQTDARAYDHAAASLSSVGATVLGGVLNRFDDRRHDPYGAGYGYAYQYRRAQEYYGADRSKSAA